MKKNIILEVVPTADCCLPIIVACDEFMEFMDEYGILDENVAVEDLSDAWYAFLKEECAIV